MPCGKIRPAQEAEGPGRARCCRDSAGPVPRGCDIRSGNECLLASQMAAIQDIIVKQLECVGDAPLRKGSSCYLAARKPPLIVMVGNPRILQVFVPSTTPGRGLPPPLWKNAGGVRARHLVPV